MDSKAALAYLEGLPYREVKPGLERIGRLLECLGDPHLDLRTIHVGGTNGKGSVVALLASALEEAGYRVGTYTSPHLLDWRERIRIDGEWIPEEEFTRLLERLRPIIEEMDEEPTVFETLTALAFQWFREQAVDLAVIEVGLGGRFDATNVIKPLVAVITNVRRDHLDLLGPDMGHLIWEKAGIAKPGVLLVTGERKSDALGGIARECAERGAEFIRADIEMEQVEFTWDHQVFEAEGWGQVELSLLGPYQGENLAVVLKTVEVLRRFLELPEGAIKRGLKWARWPGRFELISRQPYIVIDGAHNPSGVRALLEGLRMYWERYLRGGQRWLLFGVLRDKEIEAMAEVLFPWFDRLLLTKPDYYRAAEPEILKELASGYGRPAEIVVPAGEAFRRARERLGKGDLLCIAGSLYLVGEVLGYGS
jgi:dihydrofolate synthase/folylpolyglutamate synthase